MRKLAAWQPLLFSPFKAQINVFHQWNNINLCIKWRSLYACQFSPYYIRGQFCCKSIFQWVLSKSRRKFDLHNMIKGLLHSQFWLVCKLFERWFLSILNGLLLFYRHFINQLKWLAQPKEQFTLEKYRWNIEKQMNLKGISCFLILSILYSVLLH